MKHDFYVPKTKYELLAWFKKNKPHFKVSRFNKNRLLAIYYGVRAMESKQTLKKEMKDSTAYKMLVDIG